MVKLSNEDYWKAYWSVGKPVRAERLRRAVKMATPRDVADLWAAVQESPHDQARWLVAADALDEMGKGGAAKLFRAAAQARPARGRAEWMENRYRRGFDMSPGSGPQDSLFDRSTGGPSVYGHVAGVHVEVHPMTDVCHVKIGSPDPGGATGYGWVTHDIGRELVADLDGPHRGYEAAFDHMKKEYTGGGAARLARAGRPVRNATTAEHKAMQEAIRAVARKRDVAPILGYADMIQEDGHDHLAQALRLASAWITERRGKSLKSPWSAATPQVGVYARHRSGVTHPNLYIFSPHQALVSMWVGGKKLNYDTKDHAHLQGLISELEPFHERTGYYGSRDQLDMGRRFLGLGPWVPPPDWKPQG